MILGLRRMPKSIKINDNFSNGGNSQSKSYLRGSLISTYVNNQFLFPDLHAVEKPFKSGKNLTR